MVTYAGLTVVGGTVITATWGNMMREAGIVPFATASDRTLAIASPNDGQMTYLTGTSQFESYKNASTSWVPAPGTVIARASRSTDSSTTTTEVGVLRLDSIPIVNGTLYKIKSSAMYLLSNTGDIVNVRYRGNTAGAATTGSTQIGQAFQTITNVSQPTSAILEVLYPSVTTGSLSVILTVNRAAGTGNTKVFGASDFWVEVAAIADPGDTGVDI